MKRTKSLIAVAVLFAGFSAAQDTIYVQQGPGVPPTGAVQGLAVGPIIQQKITTDTPEGLISFVGTEMKIASPPVKGAPYSATSVVESTQVLADGNRIVNKNTALEVRDGEGRTRREQEVRSIGPLNVGQPKIILINDPVTGTMITLFPDRQLAHLGHYESRTKNTALYKMRTNAGEPGMMAITAKAPPVTREDLGTQVIEGVNAKGTRITITIPAGQIGNERDLVTTDEQWVSPELQVMVLRKHSDPRIGETIQRLTDIRQGEPDASLFQVPSGYKVETGPPPPPLPPLPRE